MPARTSEGVRHQTGIKRKVKVCLASAPRGECGDVGEEGGGRSRMLEEAEEEPGTSIHTDYPRRMLSEGLSAIMSKLHVGSNSFVHNMITVHFRIKLITGESYTGAQICNCSTVE